jgi:hypothetical protein
LGCGWERKLGGNGTGGVLQDEGLDVTVLSDDTIVAVGYAESTTGDLTGLLPGG